MKMKKVRLIGKRLHVLVAVAAVGMGMPSAAFATKFVIAALKDQDPSHAIGETYRDVTGSPISSEITGFDVYGNVVCQTRAYWNNSRTSMVSCPASAVSYQSALRSNAGYYCFSPMTSWGALPSPCQGLVTGCSSANGCGQFYLGSLGFGGGS